MKNFKKIISIFILMCLALNLFACSSASSSNSNDTQSGEKVYKIGTLQYIQHQALDNAYKGFFDYLDEKGIKYTNDFQNASGEQSTCQTVASKFASEKLDLIYAISTPAAQSVQATNENTPIVISAVTDPAGAKLCETNERPGGLITGASDLNPIEAQIDLLIELFPNAKNVGILYCSAEANSKIQADLAISYAKGKNLNTLEATVVNSADIQTVVESLIGRVDVIYIPTDNIISSSIELVSSITNENKIPTIVGEETMVNGGATATYGIDYYKLGKIAGEMAEEILINGKNPADMPIRYMEAKDLTRKINKNAKELFGIDVD